MVKGIVTLVVWLFILFSLFFNGRYNVTAIGENTSPSASVYTETHTARTWLTGLIPAKPVHGCNQAKIVQTQTKVTLLGSIIAVSTFGIYTPVRVIFTCTK